MKRLDSHLGWLLALVLVPTACLTPPPAKGPSTAEGSSAAGTSPITTSPYTWKNVEILGGGFVTGIIFSGSVKGLAYARTDIGGAYRIDPGSERWLPITDWIGRDDSNALGIESLALDPTNPDVVYLATGTYTKSWAGTGAMLRSADRGKTWDVAPLTIKLGGNEWGRHCGERLAVDPNQPSRVFFGSRQDGLLVSEDAGKSWDQRPGLPQGTGNDPIGITVILFDKKSGQPGTPTPVVYAAADNSEGSVFVSRDAGKTWTILPGQPKGFLACHVELDPGGKLFASYGNAPGPNDVTDGAVYVLDPKANTATNITPLRPSAEDTFGYAGLSLDPSSPGTLVVTTIDRWTKKDNIFRTTDGGKTWAAFGQSSQFNVNGAEWYKLHRPTVDVPGWLGDFDIDPFDPEHATFVTGAGVWRTRNLRKADSKEPVEFRFSNQGLEETATITLLSPRVGAPLLSGLGDICGLRHEDLFRTPSYGAYDPPCQNGTGLDFAELKPELMVRTGTVWWFAPDPKPHGSLSSDGGMTWQGFPKEPAGAERGGTVAMTADGSSIVWIMKANAPAYSRDRGQTWQKVQGLRSSNPLPDWTSMDLQPAADRVDPKQVTVYDAMEGTLYVSRDGGASFSKGSDALPTLADYQLNMADIEAVPGFSGHLWLSTGKELYRSTDGGKSVDALDSVQESYGVGLGKAAPGTMYPTLFIAGKVAETKGLFRSIDQGETWERINDDAHQYGNVTVVEGDPRVFGRVYIGATGRGVVVGEPTQ